MEESQLLRTSAPTSTEGIEKYVSSGMIRGIGPDYTRKLVRAFTLLAMKCGAVGSPQSPHFSGTAG
jgi:hypothetical protein